jgi:hypothetical protein
VKRVRRFLLEIWAILPVAAVVGFLGPFGSYLGGDFFQRVGRWWIMLMGAYILARPMLLFWRWIARATGLPQGSLVFWGMIFSSFPLALVWRIVGSDEIRLLGGYSGLLPFAVLCSLLVTMVVGWAERADAHLLQYYDAAMPRARSFINPGPAIDAGVAPGALAPAAATPVVAPPAVSAVSPRLHARLSPRFEGEILALESEDHYVRVHGPKGSELLFLRLRDAIAEMDGRMGEQTHRSWWVARDAVAGVSGAGRNREIELVNGERAPVARDSVDRLLRSGFLPA